MEASAIKDYYFFTPELNSPSSFKSSSNSVPVLQAATVVSVDIFSSLNQSYTK